MRISFKTFVNLFLCIIIIDCVKVTFLGCLNFLFDIYPGDGKIFVLKIIFSTNFFYDRVNFGFPQMVPLGGKRSKYSVEIKATLDKGFTPSIRLYSEGCD